MNKPINKMSVSFSAKSQNEGFARVVVSSFVAQLDPVVSDMEDIKTAVSEGVTNSIVHGYEGENGIIRIDSTLYEDGVEIMIKDFGKGIYDIDMALKPMYTSKPGDERSGLGFTVMEAFMDKLEIESVLNVGTTIKMYKKIEGEKEIQDDDKDDKEVISNSDITNILEDYFES